MATAELAQRITDAISQLEREGQPIIANKVHEMTGGTRTEVLRAVRQYQEHTGRGSAPPESGPEPHGAPGSDVRRPEMVLSSTPMSPPPAPSVLGGQLADAQRAWQKVQHENGQVTALVRELEAQRTALIDRQKAALSRRQQAQTLEELRRIKTELLELDEAVELVSNRLRPVAARTTMVAQRYQSAQRQLFACQEQSTRTLEEMRGLARWGTEGGQRKVRAELIVLIGEQEAQRLVENNNLERPSWSRP